MIVIAFRFIWWWIMFLLQLLGEQVLATQTNGINSGRLGELVILSFEFHILYGFLLVVNGVFRYFIVLEDGRSFKSLRLGVHVHFQVVTDVLLFIFSLFYLIPALGLF